MESFNRGELRIRISECGKEGHLLVKQTLQKY